VIELLLLAGLVLCAAAFMWSSARVWQAQRSAGRVLAPGPGRDPAGNPRPARVGSGGTGSGGGMTPVGASVADRLPESSPARVKLGCQDVGVASEDASGRSR